MYRRIDIGKRGKTPDEKREYNKRYYLVHKEEIVSRVKNYYEQVSLGVIIPISKIDKLPKIRVRKPRIPALTKYEKKIECFKHYSKGNPECACCGEKDYHFLCMDHINGGGNKHRAEMKIDNIYPWLRRNNYPDGFQVLCHNCNMAKSIFGSCPHLKVAAV